MVCIDSNNSVCFATGAIIAISLVLWVIITATVTAFVLDEDIEKKYSFSIKEQLAIILFWPIVLPLLGIIGAGELTERSVQKKAE